MPQVHEPIIAAFRNSSPRREEADPGSGLRLSLGESLARPRTVNGKLSERPPGPVGVGVGGLM